MYRCGKRNCGKEFIFPAIITTENKRLGHKVSLSVCPYCFDINIFLVQEKFLSEKIISVIQVRIENVDSYIQKGYQPYQYYKDYITMRKIEVK